LVFNFIFKKKLNRFSHSVITTDSLVFNQGITHDDTLKGSNWDARMISKGICDIGPTLEKTLFATRF
jgi:hypothetical protein